MISTASDCQFTTTDALRRLVEEASEIELNSMGMTFRLIYEPEWRLDDSPGWCGWQAAPTRRGGGCDWDSGETCWLEDWDCPPEPDVMAVLNALRQAIHGALYDQARGQDGRVGNVVFWGNMTASEISRVATGQEVQRD